MKIIKFKKMHGSKYKVTLDNTELVIYEEVILKNNLLRKNEVTLDLLELIMEENKYYEIYDLCLSYIDTKMRCESEIKDYLEKKGFEEELIYDCIERLKTEGLLNEKRYIEAYINDSLALTNKGPYKIKRNLLDLELNESLIDEYLNTFDESTWISRMEKIIEKKLKLMKNKSESQIKNKLREDLFNLGYDKDQIESYLLNFEKDDNNSMRIEYDKAYKKYSKKYEGNELKNQIKSYLYRKGYQTDNIDILLSEVN